MKRVIIFCLLSYIAAVLLQDVLEIDLIWALAFPAVLAVIVKAAFFRRQNTFRILLVILCFVVGSINFTYHDTLLHREPTQFAGETVHVTGKVVEVSDTTNRFYDRYVLEVTEIAGGGRTAAVRERMDLSLLKVEQHSPISPLKYGTVICVEANLDTPDEPMNSTDTDYLRYRKTQGIFFSLQSEYDSCTQIGTDIKWYRPYDAANAVREYAFMAIDTYLTGDRAALLKGILFSDKNALSDSMNSALKISGVSHIATASGLHVSGVLMLVSWLLSAFRLRKKVIYLISAVVLAGFALIQGCTPSILRATIMAYLFMLADILQRDEDRLTSLAVAALALVLLNPFTIYDVGFLMSFGAVLGIILFCGPLSQCFRRIFRFRWLYSAVSVTLSAQIFLVPILAYYFNYFAVYTVLANLLTVPVIPVVLGLGFGLILIHGIWGTLAAGIAMLLNGLLSYLCGVILWVAGLPYASFSVASPSLFVICVYLGIIFMLYFMTRPMRETLVGVLCGVCICFLIMNIVQTTTEKQFCRVSFINVGQGDATLIQLSEGTNLLIDGGGSAPASESDVGEKILLPYLMRKGISRIDVAVVSHFDKDHAQGVASVLRELDVGRLIVPLREETLENEYQEELLATASAKGIPVSFFRQGDRVQIGELAELCTLAPSDFYATNPALHENNRSLVLKFSYGAFDVLFPGDIESNMQRSLVASDLPLDAEVLKVAHHGASDANTASFIDAVSPQLALIGVAADNIYGHPAQQTLQTLENAGALVLRTDVCGDITILADDKRIHEVRTFRHGPVRPDLPISDSETPWSIIDENI